MQKNQKEQSGALARALDVIEYLGNKLPDPAILFLIAMTLVGILSAVMAGIDFSAIHPRSQEQIKIINLLSGEKIVAFMATTVATFTSFAPLGVVLVAMLGVGVAEVSGFINAGLRLMLGVAHKSLLTPILILAAVVSHTATDAGYVLVIPLGGVIFYAAGRHPLAGIAAAFAGVSGGFSANFLPSAIDVLLQNFTQIAAQMIEPKLMINPLCNIYFTGASSALVIAIGWVLTDRFIEPRLNAHLPVDKDADKPVEMEKLSEKEAFAFKVSSVVVLVCLLILGLVAYPDDSPFRLNGKLVEPHSPMMDSIVTLIFILFVIPGVVYGYMTQVFTKTKDIIMAMSKTMNGMSYYIVMAFFCALFVKTFTDSNLGVLLAVEGGTFLKEQNLPGTVTITGIVFLTATVNLLIGSASAKWALLSPIFVPMLMQLGFSPELTQAAYRVGDSCTNIVTPLMPYFPLVVVYCQKYVKNMGIGSLVSIMLPYSAAFLLCWTAFLMIYWTLGIPMGSEVPYVYPAP